MTDYDASNDLVSPEESLEHAVLAVARDLAVRLPGMASFGPLSIRATPTEVYDLNGEVLFRDYTVGRGRIVAGYVRMAASRVIGTPHVATELGARAWNFEAAVKRLTPRARKTHAGAKLLGRPKLVCYSYPKLGVMFEIAVDGRPTQVVYDVASLDPVPLAPDRPDIEGAYAWSFYAALPGGAGRSARLRRYAAMDKARLALPAAVWRKLLAARSLELALKLVAFKYRRSATKLLQFCPHYAYDHARGHHCFSLSAQQVNDYCAVATCQMILCYYRYYYAQVDIAPACGYNAGSGCPSDQSPGYESLSCNHLDAAFDNAPTWSKAKTQIDGLHPFKSGIPGHARACAGYSATSWIFGGTFDEKLYIYDPWPWNANIALGGAVYWEDWAAITHTNYVTTRVDCP
jgi:hypothetical protein